MRINELKFYIKDEVYDILLNFYYGILYRPTYAGATDLANCR